VEAACWTTQHRGSPQRGETRRVSCLLRGTRWRRRPVRRSRSFGWRRHAPQTCKGPDGQSHRKRREQLWEVEIIKYEKQIGCINRDVVREPHQSVGIGPARIRNDTVRDKTKKPCHADRIPGKQRCYKPWSCLSGHVRDFPGATQEIAQVKAECRPLQSLEVDDCEQLGRTPERNRLGWQNRSHCLPCQMRH